MSESYLTTDRSAMLQAALDNLIAFAEDYLDHRPHDPSGLTLAILDAKGAIRRVNELAIPAPERALTTEAVVAYLEALLPTMTQNAATLMRLGIDALKAGR